MSDTPIIIEVEAVTTRKHRITLRRDHGILYQSEINARKAEDREAFVRRVLKKFPGIVDAEALEKEIMEQANRQVRTKQSTDPASADTKELLAQTPPEILADAEDMLRNSELMDRIVEDVANLGVAGEHKVISTIYLIGTSRLLTEPLAAIVQGPSSTGKSYVISKVAELFPLEAVIHATHMTPQALFHMQPGSLVHRFVVAGERSRLQGDEAKEATKALREMLSEHQLSKLMPVRMDGKFETVQITQDGPIAFVESTTATEIFDEDLNRCILINTDERPEQTARVLRKKAAVARTGRAPARYLRQIILKHHAAQRMLESKPVFIPYAQFLETRFPSDRVEARRVFGHLLNMISASALLHQFQRDTAPDGRIIAVASDYGIARHLLAKPISRSLGGAVSDGAKWFFDQLRTLRFMYKVRELSPLLLFTTKDAAEHLHMSDRAASGHLSELHTAGMVELVEPARGPKPNKWKFGNVSAEEESSGPFRLHLVKRYITLPTVEELCAWVDSSIPTTRKP